MESKRLPRFKRAPRVAPMQLTERDRTILCQIHRHRFLRSSQIIALIGKSSQPVLRRLQLLYHHGYLERPRAQIDYYHRGGSRQIVYGIGHKGAAILKRMGGVAFHELDWAAKNRSVGRIFLEHALLVSEVMVALEIACRKSGHVRLLIGKQLSLPNETALHRTPFQWQVKVNQRHKIGLIPDQVFAFQFLDRPLERSLAYFFLEADRGTMPVRRDNYSQSSFHRKLVAYEATWTQNIHRARFNFHRFRVLTITTSPDRVKSLVDACSQLERGRGLFLFGDLDKFTAHANPLGFPFITGDPPKTSTLSG